MRAFSGFSSSLFNLAPRVFGDAISDCSFLLNCSHDAVLRFHFAMHSSNLCASVCKHLQAPACASAQLRGLPLFTYASKSLRAYAPEGVTCQIQSGAKHVAAIQILSTESRI